MKKCDNCGMSLGDILESGVVGCANCYDVFEENLAEIIKKMQKNTKNLAKKPKFSEISEFQRDRVMRLKVDLEKALSERDYIRAGEIDKMLEGILGGENRG